MKKIEMAYFAGFFDGEGSVYAATRWHRTKEKDRRPTPTLTVCIGNTNFEVLRLHHEIFGGSLSERKNLAERRLPQMQWMIAARQAEPYLRAIHPFLIIKREVVSVALEYIELLKTPRSEQRDYSNRELDKRGRLASSPIVRPEFRKKVLDIHGRIRELNAGAAPHNVRRALNPWEN